MEDEADFFFEKNEFAIEFALKCFLNHKHSITTISAGPMLPCLPKNVQLLYGYFQSKRAIGYQFARLLKKVLSFKVNVQLHIYF